MQISEISTREGPVVRMIASASGGDEGGCESF